MIAVFLIILPAPLIVSLLSSLAKSGKHDSIKLHLAWMGHR